MNERNEELLSKLEVVKRLIHSYASYDKELAQIKASYQKPNLKYKKIWKSFSPLALKIILFSIFMFLQYEALYALSYQYFALYVVTRTLLDQTVYKFFFMVFIAATSYFLLMLIQLTHNKSAFQHNTRLAQFNADVNCKNQALGQRQIQVLDQLDNLSRQFSECTKGWYPTGHAREYDIDFLVQVVSTGEAPDLSTACKMLRQEKRYNDMKKAQQDYLEEMKRHNYQEEKNQIFNTVVQGASSMAMAGAMNNQADAMRNQTIHVHHTNY